MRDCWLPREARPLFPQLVQRLTAIQQMSQDEALSHQQHDRNGSAFKDSLDVLASSSDDPDIHYTREGMSCFFTRRFCPTFETRVRRHWTVRNLKLC